MSEARGPKSGKITGAAGAQAAKQIIPGTTIGGPTQTVALLNNGSGTIYIGDSGIDTNGWPLGPKESISIDTEDPTSIYALIDNTQDLRWIASKL